MVFLLLVVWPFGLFRQQFVKKYIVTPAEAGVQNIMKIEISNRLDSGFRRNDGLGCLLDFFNEQLEKTSPIMP